MLISISALTGGCATSGCGGWEKITISHKDHLTRKTKESIVSHNEFGEKQGCWTAGQPWKWK